MSSCKIHLSSLRAERDDLRDRIDLMGRPSVVKLRRAAVDSYQSGEAVPAQTLESIVETVTIVPAVSSRLPGLVMTGDLAGLVDRHPEYTITLGG